VKTLKEEFVIAYYGSIHSKVYMNPIGWKDIYIGEGIIHESKSFNSYPTPTEKLVLHFAPKNTKYKYAKIEKRFYPNNK
jgi:hypothetical protein